jgi:hypothetical protein
MKEEELKRLIGKYYSGTSTEEDERALRASFSQNIAPQGFEAEWEMFRYFMSEGEVPEPSADFESRIGMAVASSGKGKQSSGFRKLLVPMLSAAAGLLILTGTYLFFARRDQPLDTYSDPKIAYAETMRILTEVSSRMNQGMEPLQSVGRINEMKEISFGSINRSASIVEKNLKTLGYLRKSGELNRGSKEKAQN